MDSILRYGTLFLVGVTVTLFTSCTQETEQAEGPDAKSEVSQADEIPLIYHMSFISRYTQKLYFAGEAENWELADIYNHEIEEISEDIVARGEEHDGINISGLMETMLLPQIEEIEEAIDAGDREMFLDRYSVMIQSCNNCHQSADYGAVKVIVPESNPFNQDFSPE
ncbi:MAG: hypothetical protein R6V27_06950 [Balneolaceae bacterium]